MALKFKYTFDQANPFYLSKQPQSEVRAEYSRLRSVAQKRLQRLEQAGFLREGVALSRRRSFKKLAEMKDPRDVRASLVDLYRFLHAETSTVGGQRRVMRRTIANFQFYGIKNINEKNYFKYIEYLEHLKEEYDIRKMVASPQIIEYLAQVKNLSMAAEELERDFEKWLSAQDESLTNRGSKKK